MLYTFDMALPNYARSDKFVGRGLDSFGLKQRLLREISKRSKGGKRIQLLEVGCGQGNLLLDLLALYPRLQASGINKSNAHGIRNEHDLKRRSKERGLASAPRAYIGDAIKLPFQSETFDIVISHVTLLHVHNKAKAIEEIYRVLKPGGIALASLGPYSIRRKVGHAMPSFYRSLHRRLGTDFNPRFLIKSGAIFVPLSVFISDIGRRTGLRLLTRIFTSESQRGIAQWLVIRKKEKGILRLGLQFLPHESQKLTHAFSKKNPVNWGVIDLYRAPTSQVR